VEGFILSDRNIILIFEMSALQNRLNTLMKADLDTCWNSKFQMFDSIIYQWDRILEVLVEKKQEKLIYCVGKKKKSRGGFYWLFDYFQ
jgi:hypothetical protein